jgi:DNA-binding transcriptional LysR family regulator
MPELSNSELRRLDLTVLLVFLGLMKHRKATVVAADLGLTPSAVSQALRRLRSIFHDDLFLRRPHGLDPTAVAVRLEGPIREAVDSLRGAVGAVAAFDPATARRVVRIAALDAEQAALVPGLIHAATRSAPGLQIATRPIARRAAMEALVAGEIDIGLGFYWDVPDTLVVTPLYSQGFKVVGRPERLEEPLTLARYTALPHVLVSPAGDLGGIVDTALEALGLSRRVVAAVPQFFPALMAAAETGCLVTLPDRLADRHAARFGLLAVDPPLTLRRFEVSALRHRRNARDGMTDWVISALHDVIRADD